jgi:hypothetical protein
LAGDFVSSAKANANAPMKMPSIAQPTIFCIATHFRENCR